jgi:hypothetical protein
MATSTAAEWSGTRSASFPPSGFSATSTSQKLSVPYPQKFELLSIKNATTVVSAASGLVGISRAAEPSRVSEFFFLPLTVTGGDVARVSDQTTISLD